MSVEKLTQMQFAGIDNIFTYRKNYSVNNKEGEFFVYFLQTLCFYRVFSFLYSAESKSKIYKCNINLKDKVYFFYDSIILFNGIMQPFVTPFSLWYACTIIFYY